MLILLVERAVKWGGYVLAPLLIVMAPLFVSFPGWSVLLAVLAALFLAVSIWFSYQALRPNRSKIDPELGIEEWGIIRDGTHNSNTDMILWNDTFYLAHATSPFHLASRNCRIVIRSSKDGKEWTELVRLSGESRDIRDPKFAIVDEKLFLYVMLNRTLNPEPYTSVYSVSEDGKNWSPFEPTGHPGWLFWRPKKQNVDTWFLPAYWWEHGKSRLFRSTDGKHWDIVSDIYEGGRNDETAIEFLTDNRLIAVARLEYSERITGDRRGCTQIAVSDYPFTSWNHSKKDSLTRLDGPALFRLDDAVVAVGRFQPVRRGVFAQPGSIFAAKRTSLFLVNENGLIHLSDLPSAGDTSYGAVVEKDGYLYICYYTSRTDRDFVWIEGMLAPSDIRIVRLERSRLRALVEKQKSAETQRVPAPDDESAISSL